MQDLSLIRRLHNRLPDVIEEKAYQALLGVYTQSQLWEIVQKRIIYKKLLTLWGKNISRLTLKQMHDMIPQEMHIRIEVRLHKKRIFVLQKGVFEQLTQKGIRKINQYREKISSDKSDTMAFEWALRRYLRLYTKGNVPIEARDDAAKYLHYKLEEQAWKNDLLNKLDHDHNHELSHPKDQLNKPVATKIKTHPPLIQAVKKRMGEFLQTQSCR